MPRQKKRIEAENWNYKCPNCGRFLTSKVALDGMGCLDCGSKVERTDETPPKTLTQNERLIKDFRNEVDF